MQSLVDTLIGNVLLRMKNTFTATSTKPLIIFRLGYI
jgi:hypothetical protein